MIDTYLTISDKIGEGYYTEKRSKFLAYCHHVDNIHEIKEILAFYRKKYYDARHICYAYVLGPERQEYRVNDDGEPSSTAGKPILGQINSKKLTNIIIVVIRYYGGINLGTGGLILAYKEAAKEAINDTEIIEKQVEEIIVYTFSYIMMNDVMRIVKEMSAKIINQKFDNTCERSLSIIRSKADELHERLNKLSFK